MGLGKLAGAGADPGGCGVYGGGTDWIVSTGEVETVKLIKMRVLDHLKESDLGLREAIAWSSGYIEEGLKIIPNAVYSAKEVGELFDYFYQLMQDGR